jgi:nucleotide-binding universal stress UspA family protein
MPTAILAAIDFSPLSDAVLELAAELAGATRSPLVVLHAAAPDPEFVGYEVGPQHVRDQRATELREEHHKLAEIGADLRARGLEVKMQLHAGPTVETVLEAAENAGAHMIVVGAHRGGRAAKLLLGSVSEDILRKAPCPVLVVPPAD